MKLTGGIVLFAVIWFLVFFIALQINPRSQSEDGKVVPGTPPSAPADLRLKRKVVVTTMVTVILWSLMASVILSGAITLHDIDWFNQLGDKTTAPRN